jgi:hypothetical protein
MYEMVKRINFLYLSIFVGLFECLYMVVVAYNNGKRDKLVLKCICSFLSNLVT